MHPTWLSRSRNFFCLILVVVAAAPHIFKSQANTDIMNFTQAFFIIS